MSRSDPRPHYGEHRPSLDASGYVRIWNPDHPLAMKDGYVLEHRMVMWDAGLLTDRSQQVHHLNHVRSDNRLENLQVEESSAAHLKHHHVTPGQKIRNQYGTWTVGSGAGAEWRRRKEQARPRPCEGCGVVIPTDRRIDALFCSESCRNRTWKRRRSGLDTLVQAKAS